MLGATGWLLPPPSKDAPAAANSRGSPRSISGAGSKVVDYRDPSQRGGLYIPDDRYNISATQLTEVDVLCSQWFLKTSHVRLLFRERPPSWATGEDLSLSYSVRKFAGLPSYVMPVAANAETWGNARPASHTTGNTEAGIQGTSSDMVAARNEVRKGWWSKRPNLLYLQPTPLKLSSKALSLNPPYPRSRRGPNC